jgi:hypothetical protein
VDDAPLAGRLRRLNTLLLGGATRLEAQELIMGAVLAMVQRYATQPSLPRQGGAGRRRGSGTCCTIASPTT